MARAGQAEIAAFVGAQPPHLLEPEELTTYTGTYAFAFPWATSEDEAEYPDRVCLDRLPWSRSARGSESSDWLGVYLLTPNYRTISCALRPYPRSLDAVADLLMRFAPGVPSRLFDLVVPLRPQRSDGFGFFIRFPSILRYIGTTGFAAIAFDLTRVGGKYFAAVLPRELGCHELLQYVMPLTSDDDAPLAIFVGCRANPWPEHAWVHLQDGDVVTVTRGHHAGPARIRVEELFQEDARWGPLHHALAVESPFAVCVLFQGLRYSIQPHFHFGVNIVQHILSCFRVDPTRTVTCAFPIVDADVQGDRCSTAIFVAEDPRFEAAGHGRLEPIFVLIDPRPLGQKHFCLQLEEPVAFPASELGSLTSLPDTGESGSVSSPPPGATGAIGPARDSDGNSAHIDVTIPEGHSWNTGVDDRGVTMPIDEPIMPAAGPSDALFAAISSPRTAVANEGFSAADDSTTSMHTAASEISGTRPATVVPDADAVIDVATTSPVGDFPDLTSGAMPGSASLIVLVYMPEFSPDLITLTVSFPTSVALFVSRLQDARSSELVVSFPDLFPVAALGHSSGRPSGSSLREWRVTEIQILARTGLPCPRSLLSAERLRFLLLMVRSGPDFAWALMQHFEAFLEGLRSASAWLLEAVQGCSALGHIETSWSQWEQLMVSAPGRFKGLIKRAELWHIESCKTRAACATFGRTVWPPAPPRAGPDLSACTQDSGHEICPELDDALRSATITTDQQIFDLVEAHVAPLPVLRRTLEEWQACLTDDELIAACADVLLVLWPEHLCDKVAGKADVPAAEPLDSSEFCPAIVPPQPVRPFAPRPVFWSGHIACSWISRWGLGLCPPAELPVFDSFPEPLPSASGFCVHFPPPPSPCSSFFQPGAGPVHLLRANRHWIERVTDLSGKLVQRALAGVPVHLAFPVNADAISPFSEWYYRKIGLGFATPKEAISGNFVDKKCPFTGNVSIRGAILKGMCISTKMKRTIIIRRNYLHYIKKFNRFEKRHSNLAVHCSPAFEPKEGDIITAGQCRPLAKTVRFNVIKVDKNQIFGSARKQFALF
ncbi:rps11 [Symbiodinium sp. CCMP2456]|nr:rps11 [Symbiodinium sp. CCMP2456]